MMDLKNKSILLSTYINTVNGETYALFGPVKNIIGYLCQKYSNVYMISQPMSGEKDLIPFLTFYREGKMIWEKKLPKFYQLLIPVNYKTIASDQTIIRLKLRDFVSNLYFILFCIAHKLDLFIGVESINTLGAILLNRLRYVKNVLYFSNDYHPKRYSRLKNLIFLKLDEISAYWSDYIWMMNPLIHKSRLERGLNVEKLAPHYIIHGGIPFFNGQPANFNSRIKYRLIYATRAGHEGLIIILKAFSDVVKKYNNATLYITGHADKKKAEVENILKDLRIKKNVKYTGFIKEDNLNHLVKYSYIGLAIWTQNIASSATYGDPEKIRRYFHYGIPVISTNNAFTASLIKKSGAGIVVNDSVESTTKAILRLFDDDIFYEKCAIASQKLGKFYQEQNLLNDSFQDMKNKHLI